MFNRPAHASPRAELPKSSPPPLGIVPNSNGGPAAAPPNVISLPDAQSRVSIIGHDLTIMGDQLTIITQGKLQLDGVVQGDLHGTEIVIGESGRLTGTVSAERVAVHGEVSGIIRGLHVSLMPKSRVEGEIHNQVLSIAEGAHFDGRVRRPEDAETLRPTLDPARIAETKPDPAAA